MSSIAESIEVARFSQDHWVSPTCSDLFNLVFSRDESDFFAFHDLREASDWDLSRFILLVWDTGARRVYFTFFTNACLAVHPIAPAVKHMISSQGERVIASSSYHSDFFTGKVGNLARSHYHSFGSVAQLPLIVLLLPTTSPWPHISIGFESQRMEIATSYLLNL